jgi:hypothetical protein
LYSGVASGGSGWCASGFGSPRSGRVGGARRGGVAGWPAGRRGLARGSWALISWLGGRPRGLGERPRNSRSGTRGARRSVAPVEGRSGCRGVGIRPGGGGARLPGEDQRRLVGLPAGRLGCASVVRLGRGGPGLGSTRSWGFDRPCFRDGPLARSPTGRTEERQSCLIWRSCLSGVVVLLA